jgi:hypothetical protein
MEQRVNPLIAATKDGLLRFADSLADLVEPNTGTSF